MASPWRRWAGDLGTRVDWLTGPLRRRAIGRRQVAFVLSGGGSLGAVQVGMLRALVEAGIRPDLVIGCSVGAINGASFAADPTVRGVARMDRLWRRLAAGNPAIMPAGFMPLAVQLARKGQALHDPAPLERLLTEELPVLDFSQLRVPFQCVATDLDTAAEYWFDQGPLVPALLASASLPAVYPAQLIDGRELIDGGVLNEIHTHRAVALGATELYVLHVGHLGDRSRPVQRPFDSAMRAYWTARRFRFEDDLRRIPDHCVVHRLPAGDTPRLRFDDFSQVAELIEAAHTHTAAYLANQAVEPGSDPVPVPAGVRRRGADRVGADRVGADRVGADRVGVDRVTAAAPAELGFVVDAASDAGTIGPDAPGADAVANDDAADEALGLAAVEALLAGPAGFGDAPTEAASEGSPAGNAPDGASPAPGSPGGGSDPGVAGGRA